ncbi:MAG: DUF3099 domain-containing protein [Actinomycetota bacterium]
MRTNRRRKGEEVHSITSARRALSEDLHDRHIRYLVSMAIRTACLFLAVFTPDPWRWIFVAGAVVLPYVAVVMANAGRERAGEQVPDVGLQESGAVQLYDPRTEYLR